MCYEQVTERRQLLEEEEDIVGRKKRKSVHDTSGPSSAATPNGVPSTGISPPVQQQQQQPLTPHAETAAATNHVSPTLQEQLDRGDSSVLQSLSKKRTETAYSRRSLLSQQEALERDDKEQAFQLLKSQSELEKQMIQQEKEASSRDLLLAAAEQNNSSPERACHRRLVRMTSSGSLCADKNLDHTKAVEEGNRHLDMVASNHLEQMCKSLLSTDAPLLFPELSQQTNQPNRLYEQWISTLMGLATRCCATVEPNVKKGDLLDIRPYVKIKGKST